MGRRGAAGFQIASIINPVHPLQKNTSHLTMQAACPYLRYDAQKIVAGGGPEANQAPMRDSELDRLDGDRRRCAAGGPRWVLGAAFRSRRVAAVCRVPPFPCGIRRVSEGRHSLKRRGMPWKKAGLPWCLGYRAPSEKNAQLAAAVEHPPGPIGKICASFGRCGYPTLE